MDSPLVGRVRFPSALTATAPPRLFNAGSGGGVDDDDDDCESSDNKNLYGRNAQKDDGGDGDQSSVDLLLMDTEDEEEDDDHDEPNDPMTTEGGGDDDDNNNDRSSNRCGDPNLDSAQDRRPAIDGGHLADDMSRSTLVGPPQLRNARQSQHRHDQPQRPAMESTTTSWKNTSSSIGNAALPKSQPPTPATKTLNDLSQDPSLGQLWYRRQSHGEEAPAEASEPMMSEELAHASPRQQAAAAPTTKDDYAPDSTEEDDEDDDDATVDPTLPDSNHPGDVGGGTRKKAPILAAAPPQMSIRPLPASESRENVRGSGAGATATAPATAAARLGRKGRGVVQLDPSTLRMVGTFESLRKAEEETGIKRKWISDAARSRGTKKAGGYLWRYENDESPAVASTSGTTSSTSPSPAVAATSVTTSTSSAHQLKPPPPPPPAAAQGEAAASAEREGATAAVVSVNAIATLAGGLALGAPRSDLPTAGVQLLAEGTNAQLPGLDGPTRGIEAASASASKDAAASQQPRIQESVQAGSATTARDERPAMAGAARSGSATPVPFCAMCTTGRARVHHAWCPHHPQFQLSGAQAILDRLVLGAGRLGCDTCRNEYQQGCRTNMAHSFRCREYTAAHAIVAAPPPPRLPNGSGPNSSTYSFDENHNRTSGRSARSTKMNRHDRHHCDDDEEYEDAVKGDDVDSAMSCDSDDDADDSIGRAHAKGTKEPGRSRKPKPRPTSRRRTIKSATAAMSAKKVGHSRAITPYDYDTDEDEDDDDSAAIVVEWKECENPWGPDEYQDEDVILFSGRTPDLAHIETLLPSKRFVVDPFVGPTPYRATHHAPQEGFQVVQLRRDPVAKLDWGFSARAHVFGGACLVTAVDPVSPASSAVFLGASTEKCADAALRVNDMIVCINGRRVGGMMESEFGVELEASGVVLTLVLSRYKHAESVEDRLRAAEKQFQEAVDGAINDQRRLGWVDLIPTSRAASIHAPATEPAPATGRQSQAPVVANVSNGHGTHRQSRACVDLVPTSRAAFSHAQSSGPSRHGDQHHPASPMDMDNSSSIQSAVPGSLTKAIVQAADHNYTAANERQAIQVSDTRKSPFESGRQQSHQSGLGSPLLKGNNKSGMDEDANLGGAPAASSEEPLDFDFGAGLCDDYDQAWVGCACGIIHDQGVAVFWLQCDSCKSWYNVSPQCVMFTEEEAKTMPTWVCWGCTPPPPRPCAAENAPRELGTPHGSSLGPEEPALALPSNQSTGETTAGALEHLAVARTQTTEELHLAHAVAAKTAYPTTASKIHDSRTPEKESEVLDSNAKPSMSNGSEASSPGHAGVLVGAQKRNRNERKCSSIDPSAATISNPPQVSATSHGDRVPGEAAAHPRSERRRGIDKGRQQSRGQPSEMIDDSLIYYKGGWVPNPKYNDDGTPVASDPKPVLSVGDRVLVREHGRADHGTGTIVATKVDTRLGRFYDVKFIVGRHTVRDVHEHFVDLLQASGRTTTGA